MDALRRGEEEHERGSSGGLLPRFEFTAMVMAGSSLLVALNALMLKRTRLPGIRAVRPNVSAAATAPVLAPAHHH